MTAAHTFSVGTLNLGNAKMPDLRALLRTELHVSAWALQEAGDWPRLDEFVARLGWAFLDGYGRPGESSTPLLVSPETWLLRRPWTRLLLGHRTEAGGVEPLYAGPGAGPVKLKPKWIMGAQLRHRCSGVPLRIASVHYPASQHMPRRAALARMMSRRLARAGDDYAAPVIYAGDYNAVPNAATLAPLRAGRWQLTQEHHHYGDVATHGNRAIDGMAFTRRAEAGQLRLHGVERLRSIGSDHRPYVATFTIREADK